MEMLLLGFAEKGYINISGPGQIRTHVRAGATMALSKTTLQKSFLQSSFKTWHVTVLYSLNLG